MPRMLKPACLLLSLTLIAAGESHPPRESGGFPDPGDVVVEVFDSYGLRWEPLVELEEAALTVTGREGLVWEQEFKAGEPLSFELLDLQAAPLPDGSYAYEWRVTFTPVDVEATQGPVVKVQSGRFRILEGVAESLSRPLPVKSFPMVTNASGNHFENTVTIADDLCVGCEDGELTDYSWAYWADLIVKGPFPGIVLESTGSPKEDWRIANQDGLFSIWDAPTGTEQWAYPFTIEDQASNFAFYIASSGKIGMGTSTPTASLHIARSDGTARLLVKETSPTTEVRTMFELKNNGAPRFALKNRNSGIEWSFQQSGPGNFLISKEATGGPEMQVYTTGRVRMGPGGARNFDLDPSGNLQIKGTLTAGADGITFPDYVFERDYDLMPLSDLRIYIQQEKRLPGIPSAEEVKKQGGHNMTEMQLKLLEKIEELTLYTLEQEKRLHQKDAELFSQRERTQQLEARVARMETLELRLAAIEATLSDR